MSEFGFAPFPKIGRLTRECVITEKLDGTNAQVHIAEVAFANGIGYETDITQAVAVRDRADLTSLVMWAGSRTRYITPEADNHGFAAWVRANADDLFALGEGRHFGEWWGGKIQRGVWVAGEAVQPVQHDAVG